MLDIIHHHEHDMVADVYADVAAKMDVDVAYNIDIDLPTDMDDEGSCIYGPISIPNILVDHFLPTNYFNSAHFQNSAHF
jgi:hypothetical protein